MSTHVDAFLYHLTDLAYYVNILLYSLVNFYDYGIPQVLLSHIFNQLHQRLNYSIYFDQIRYLTFYFLPSFDLIEHKVESVQIRQFLELALNQIFDVGVSDEVFDSIKTGLYLLPIL